MEIVLPAPLPHQIPVLEHDARFKLWRAGRRTGKSRGGLIAAVAGHGRKRVRRGILQGGFVAWFAPDYKQAQAIWREEIRPRFGGLPGVDVSEVEKRITIHGLGALQILSAENIDAARGWKLDGAVLDEPAYWDAEYGWNAVIRAALADRQGWAWFGSTTNAGHDGNQLKRVPSYFNQLCERVEKGEMGPEWVSFHNRTEDNPKIPRAEIASLRAEYPEGSAIAAQELDAELGVIGGRYYEQITKDVHLVNRDQFPGEWPNWWDYFGSYDWGYAHWSVYGAWAWDGDGTLILIDTLWLRREQDEEYADKIVKWQGAPAQCRRLVFAGHDCWAKVTARGASGVPTVNIFAPKGIYLRKADNDRANGGRAVRRALSYEKDKATGDLVKRPKVVMVDTPGNRRVLEQMQAIIPDPLDINKPLKADADTDGRGGDDGADMFRYGVATWPRTAKPDEATPEKQQHKLAPLDWSSGKPERVKPSRGEDLIRDNPNGWRMPPSRMPRGPK